jgi:hypothetical protein
MPVVGEGLRDTEPTHNDERNVINDSSLDCHPLLVIRPRLFPVILGRHDQLLALLKRRPQLTDLTAKGPSGSGIPALQQYEGGRDNRLAPSLDLGKRLIGGKMPLIRYVPEGYQIDRIEENQVHG